MAVTIAQLLREHPRIKVDLQLSNRPIDLVEEGIDVAVRVAASLDGRYVARPIALARPRRPEDLTQHRGLVFLEPRPRDEWVFERTANPSA